MKYLYLIFCVIFLNSCSSDDSGSSGRISCNSLDVNYQSITLSGTLKNEIIGYFQTDGSYGDYFIPTTAQVALTTDVSDTAIETSNFVVFKKNTSSSVSNSDLECAAKYVQHFFNQHIATMGISLANLSLGSDKLFLHVTNTASNNEAGHGYPFGLSVGENFLGDDQIISHELVHNLESIYFSNNINSHTGRPTEGQSVRPTPDWFKEGLALYLANQDGGVSNNAVESALNSCNNVNPIFKEKFFPGGCDSFTYYPLYRDVFDYTASQGGNAFIKLTLDYLISNGTGESSGVLENFDEAFDSGTQSGQFTNFVNNYFFGTKIYTQE